MLEDDIKIFLVVGKCLLLINFDINLPKNIKLIVDYIIPISYLIICTISNYVAIREVFLNKHPEVNCNVTFVGYVYQIFAVTYTYFIIIYFVLRRNDLKAFIASLDDHNNMLHKPFNEINWKIKGFVVISYFCFGISILNLLIKNGLTYVLYTSSVGYAIDTSMILLFLFYVFLREINQQFIKINEMIMKKEYEKINTLNNIVVAMDFHFKVVKICKNAEDLFGLPSAMIMIFYLICLTCSFHYMICMVAIKRFEALFFLCFTSVIFIIVHISLTINIWQVISIQVR